jgi:hypothetical protein
MTRLLLLLTACFSLHSLCAADGEFPPPDQMLLKWYQEHAAGKGVFLDEKAESKWSFVFEPELAAIVGARRWSYDPLYFAQDAEVKDVKTRVIDQIGGQALVLIAFTNFGEPVRLIAHLNVTDHGWRLANIVHPALGSSLLSDLDLGEEPSL